MSTQPAEAPRGLRHSVMTFHSMKRFKQNSTGAWEQSEADPPAHELCNTWCDSNGMNPISGGTEMFVEHREREMTIVYILTVIVVNRESQVAQEMYFRQNLQMLPVDRIPSGPSLSPEMPPAISDLEENTHERPSVGDALRVR